MLLVQAGYYLATGLVPFVSRRAFEAVTGPKREWWLVQTVGALVTVIGGALASAATHRRITPEVLAVAAGSAAALATIDAVHAPADESPPLSPRSQPAAKRRAVAARASPHVLIVAGTWIVATRPFCPSPMACTRVIDPGCRRFARVQGHTSRRPCASEHDHRAPERTRDATSLTGRTVRLRRRLIRPERRTRSLRCRRATASRGPARRARTRARRTRSPRSGPPGRRRRSRPALLPRPARRRSRPGAA